MTVLIFVFAFKVSVESDMFNLESCRFWKWQNKKPINNVILRTFTTLKTQKNGIKHGLKICKYSPKRALTLTLENSSLILTQIQFFFRGKTSSCYRAVQSAMMVHFVRVVPIARLPCFPYFQIYLSLSYISWSFVK